MGDVFVEKRVYCALAQKRIWGARPIFKKLFKKLKNEIVQDVPSELEECMVCGKNKCPNEEWIKCENRIAHMNKKIAHSKCLEEAEN